MGTNFTDIATGANANAAVFNSPLDELDAAIENLKDGTTAFTSLNLDFSTEDVVLVDAGSSGASEQDWIEVTVGGNTGYVRVYASK